MGSVTKEYLEMLDIQREEIFEILTGIEQDLIWKRPKPGKWSIGEQLGHLQAITRFMRRFLAILWPLICLIGWLRRTRNFTANIDDVYERPGFPLNVGWLWPPKYTPDKPVPLSVLKEALEKEHAWVQDFYRSKPESVLGNAPLYDPAIGWLNMLQMLRVAIYHDAHHYREAKEILRNLTSQEQDVRPRIPV